MLNVKHYLEYGMICMCLAPVVAIIAAYVVARFRQVRGGDGRDL